MKRDIIIYLITQEFKYVQLIFGLEKLGFIYEDNAFTLLDVFQSIIEIQPQANRKFPVVSDRLQDTYNKWLDKAMEVEINDVEAVKTLANLCFEDLMEIIKRDNNIK